MTGDDGRPASLLERRARLLGADAPLFYERPIHVVRGEDVWLHDAEGRRYLDAYNNTAHVGHGHPRVVRALCEQAGVLNTHTRYLHTGILDYVERLTATFDPGLSTAILTCTGSEANDVALRMAQAATGRLGIVATDATYHGNTALVSQLSTLIPSAGERAPYVRLVRSPDVLREPAPGAAAEAFVQGMRDAVADLDRAGFGTAAFILCPFLANEGFPNLDDRALRAAVEIVREAGGVVVADEVQPGFGRLGSHMWGHQRAGFVPDIVTLGKPMGNGHPVAGVVTTAPILDAFRGAFRYFNTFGGNPVSCAVANAVLEVIAEEGLVANAAAVGGHAMELMRRLEARTPRIGEVRGAGLFIGAEIVADDAARTPDPDLAARLVEGMRDRGVLIGRAGLHDNVLKIRPPLTFTRQNAEFLVDTLAEVLEAAA